jgi:hypothetical protein
MRWLHVSKAAVIQMVQSGRPKAETVTQGAWNWIRRPRIVVIITDAEGDMCTIKRLAKMHDAFEALGDITQWLRSESKYGEGPMDRDDAYERLWSILRERELDPFED